MIFLHCNGGANVTCNLQTGISHLKEELFGYSILHLKIDNVVKFAASIHSSIIVNCKLHQDIKVFALYSREVLLSCFM